MISTIINGAKAYMAMRVDSEYALDATNQDAITALQGEHPEGSYHHHEHPVYVAWVYAEDTETSVSNGARRRIVKRKKGEPMFGYSVTVYGRGISFGQIREARVSSASFTGDAAEATAFYTLLGTAIGLASAANQKSCSVCLHEISEHENRQARIEAAHKAAEQVNADIKTAHEEA